MVRTPPCQFFVSFQSYTSFLFEWATNIKAPHVHQAAELEKIHQKCYMDGFEPWLSKWKRYSAYPEAALLFHYSKRFITAMWRAKTRKLCAPFRNHQWGPRTDFIFIWDVLLVSFGMNHADMSNPLITETVFVTLLVDNWSRDVSFGDDSLRT